MGMPTSGIRKVLASALIAASPLWAQASIGLVQIAGQAPEGPVTVYYPSSGEGRSMTRGPFKLRVAQHGDPVRGNGRLVIVSHGSGGSPWVYYDLAAAL